MKINLYRRHKPNCLGGHRWQSRSSELEERRKAWKRCDCVIHFSATIGGKFGRKATPTCDWDEARAFASAQAISGTWEGALTVPPPPAPEAASAPRISISDACKIFLTNREGAELAPATLRKYRTFTKQLTGYADNRGYVMIDQFTMADADLFAASWKMGARAKGKWLGFLRAFSRFALNRKWITESFVSPDLKPPIGSSKSADKMPFTDEEIERIMAACDNPPRPMKQRDRSAGQVGCAYRNDQGDGEWTGADLKDLIELMLHTGFRISDATLFDMNRLRGNEIMIRAQKNGNHVFAWIPDSVRDRLLARAKLHGNRPFIVGRSERLETVTNVWRRRITHAFDAAGAFAHPPTPHRFRHTFARMLLERGVSVADVADLMGDEEKTIRSHYAAWVTSRQERLTGILKKTFSERPKQAVLQGGRG